MRRWISHVFVVMGILVATALQAAEFSQPAGLIREPLVLSVVLPDGQTATLDAFVTRPNLPGHFPIALITHGTDGTEHSDRDQLTPNRYAAAALSFARHGYAAVVVMRQGYGHSSGHTDYQGNSCDQPKHARAGKMAREDILAALTAIRQYAWASHDQAVLVGQSSGGFSVIAASALNPPGVQAIISFSGGRGAIHDGLVCDKKALMTVLTSYGEKALIPTLWIYTANDQSFPSQLGQQMFAAYRHAGGRGELVNLPAFGHDGHDLLISAPESFWWGSVSTFLQSNDLPVNAFSILPAPNLPDPPGLNASDRQVFKHDLADRGYEKAFATNGEGVWGRSAWARDQQEANRRALAFCQQYREKGEAACALYAAGDYLVANH